MSENNLDTNERVIWPERAIVTCGMPYGNKGLHFGHIGGVYIPADMFARFLRNRIGAGNVLLVSGTDCYGSPIMEGHRKAVEAGDFDGTIEEYVELNHNGQVETLAAYDISMSIFEGSGLGYAAGPHKEMTDRFFETLYANGFLDKLSTAQFYDTQAQMFLNGRQVLGRCPVQGCKSEKAYADECDLGHQFNPEELIAPKSTITGTVPELRPVYNWYFKLPEFGPLIREHVENMRAAGKVRPFVLSAIEEFLEPPIVYIQTKFAEEYEAVAGQLPPHVKREAEEGKTSFEIEFERIEQRDEARGILEGAGVRFRMGKTLVPFRLTGNIDWGVEAPDLDGTVAAGESERLTVWCWPESLWAPISFTDAALRHAAETGNPNEHGDWHDWWCTDDARVYQFIGEDNIYFYGVAQSALWPGMQEGHEARAEGTGDELRQTELIANHHVLFGNKKASSSGKVNPSIFFELLDHYTSDQLRAHFLSLGLGLKSVGFQPKPYFPDANPKAPDPALKESALLTNVFNRLARSCFYIAQKLCGGTLPLGEVDPELRAETERVIDEYERLMSRYELHSVMALMDGYLRYCNKYWNDYSKKAETDEERVEQTAVLANAFYLLKAATILMEPVAPHGTHKIIEMLALPCTDEEFLSWEHIREGFEAFVEPGHQLTELPPRFDFFEKHPSQL